MSVIGVFAYDEASVFPSLVLTGARAVAARERVTLRVESFDTLAVEARTPRLAPQDVDGVLVIANAVSAGVLRAFHAAGKAITLVNHRVPELPLPVVMFHNARGMRALVHHVVVDCGCRRPLFLRGVRDQFDAIEREMAFRHQLMHHDLQVPERFYLNGEFEPERAAAAVRAALKAGLSFDAVVSSDYRMAGAAIAVLRDAGIAVPEQVTVVGFGDAPEARDVGITTVAADVEELGQRAMCQLLHQMRGFPITGVTTLNVELRVRASSAIRSSRAAL